MASTSLGAISVWHDTEEIYAQLYAVVKQPIRRVRMNEYGNPPVYITENGTKCDEQLEKDARGSQVRVRDPYGQRYLELYLAQLAHAIQDGPISAAISSGR